MWELKVWALGAYNKLNTILLPWTSLKKFIPVDYPYYTSQILSDISIQYLRNTNSCKILFFWETIFNLVNPLLFFSLMKF